MTDITDPGTISNGDTPDWDAVQAYFDAIYAVINNPGQLDNNNIKAGAGISYSKLNLTNAIVAGDLTSSAVTTAKINNGAVTKDKLGVTPAALVTATAQSVATGTDTTVQFPGTSYDTDSLHATNSKLACTSAGIYVFAANIVFPADSSVTANTRNEVWIRYNGSTRLATSAAPIANSAGYLSVAGQFRASAADFIECVVYQESGGTVNVSGNFSMARLGAGS